MGTVSTAGSPPVAYAHPFIVCAGSGGPVTLWTVNLEGNSAILTLTLDTVPPGRIWRCAVLQDTHLLIHSVVDDWNTVISVYSLSHGDMQDSLDIGHGGAGAMISPSNQLFLHPNASEARIYSISITEGLGAKFNAGTVIEHPPTSTAYASDIPQPVFLSRDTVIFSQARSPDPSVHLAHWIINRSSKSATAGTGTTLPPLRLPPNDLPRARIDSMLLDSITVPVPPEDGTCASIVMAHTEAFFDFADEEPVTAVRRVSVSGGDATMGWAVLLSQRTTWLRHSTAADLLVAYGYRSIEEGMTLIVLNPSTGAVLAEHSLGATDSKRVTVCALTPSGSRIVIVRGNGSIIACPVEALVAAGLPREQDGPLVWTPCPSTVPASVPTKAADRRALERGWWRWVENAYIDERSVVLVPEDKRRGDFVVLPLQE